MKKTGLLFNENFKKLRLQKKLSQEEFGKILGVKQNMISSYENKTRSPSIEIAKRAKEYFGVSYDEILLIDSEAAKDMLNDLDDAKDVKRLTIVELEEKYDLSNISEDELKLLAATLKAHRSIQRAQND